MKRAIFSAILFTLATAAAAYEKIEFKSMLQSPAFMKPAAVALNGSRVYVTDTKVNSVFVFDAEGKQLKKIDGALKAPEAAVYGGGNLYVADTGNSRIAVFDADGKMLFSFGSSGDAPGQFDGPKGIAFGPDGRLYVSNTGASRIDVFNADGIYLYGFPTAKSDGVTKLNPAKIVLSRAGDVLVSDPAKAIVQRYDRTGKLLKEYPMANNGVAVDKFGFLYVINSKEGKVYELNEAGVEVAKFGTKGKGKSEFKNLRDIAISADGVFYLCDEENKKVVLLKVEGAGEGSPELSQATLLDRFAVKGPVAKMNYKADVFTVTPDGKVVAWLPEAKELALIEGTSKKTLVKEGKLQGQVRAPRDIFVDSKGLIYVADTGNDRIQIFNPDGTYNNMFGESGSGEGQFRAPSGVAVNSKGNIYVADTKNKMLKAFTGDGMFMFAKGPQIGNITLMSPVAVACDENKNVYILDSVLKKVIVTDAMGKFLRLWDDSGALREPASLSTDGKGFFYILDKGAFNVKIFDENGAFTASFFAKGRGERELWAPQFLAFRNDKVYISDLETGRLVAFDISYLPEAPAAVAAVAGEKSVKLSWQAKTNAWTSGFKVFRGTSPGDLVEIAAPKEAAFEDAPPAPNTKYYYAAAGVSVSGIQGGLSAPVEADYKGPAAPAPAAAASAEPAGPRKNAAPLEIIAPKLEYIFSANYKQHSSLSEKKKPIGVVTVQNNTDSDFSNVVLSFFSSEIMESASSNEVGDVKAGARVEVPVYATFSNRVLNITEDTPIQCKMTLTYYKDGEEKTFTMNKPMKVLSRDAIVWDNTARLANFITVKDTPVGEFKAFAQGEEKKIGDAGENVNGKLLTGLLFWEALGDLGVGYQADPVSSYASVKSTASLALDTVQFPRKTLKLKSGDCDDLTALFATLFESAGLHAALLDYPGHIAVMFDTGETDANAVGLPEESLIKYNNTFWVGVEVTMVGKSFYDAIVYEADLYRKSAADVKVVDVRTARDEFEPVTLPDTETDKYVSAGLTARVKDAIAALTAARYDHLKRYYGNILRETPDDIEANLTLGIYHAEYKAYSEASGCFGKVLAKEPFNAAALNNMGNLRFTEGKYDEAKEFYFKATKADPFDGQVWLNLARVSAKLGKKDDVKMFADKAVKLEEGLGDMAKMLSK
ncbi:MAG: 6-bladed beta-propeller [Elusimicrobiales bacterium]|nr:6-bladed beta-propeller [Elusimicrobiales bacterium]